VAGEQALAADQQLAGSIGRQVAAVGIDDAHLPAKRHPARAGQPWVTGRVVRRGEQADHALALGVAVDLTEPAPEGLDRGGERRRRDRRGAVGDLAQAGQIGIAAQPDLGDQHVDQRGPGSEELDPVALDGVDDGRWAERRVDVHRARGQQRLQALAETAQVK
jgi:hypothetical protein